MATYFRVIDDRRIPEDTQPAELPGSLQGKIISYECATDKIVDVSGIVDMTSDRVFDVVLYSRHGHFSSPI